MTDILSHPESGASPTIACPTGCNVELHGHSANVDAVIDDASVWRREHFLNSPPGAPSSSPPTYHSSDQASLADLIARYGTSTSVAWLDGDRYKIWHPSQPIPESEFIPVQGYIQRKPFVFAWGNPLVSSPAALQATARAFIAFAEANHLHPVWCCVDRDLEAVLASEGHGWATLSCIYEDVMDPAHVIELTDPQHYDGGDELKKTLAQAEKDHIEAHEVKYGKWNPVEREMVEAGIRYWNAHKLRVEFEAMTVEPWVDEPHRRYWVAKRQDKVVGVEILSRTGPSSWQIVECIGFPQATTGVPEKLICTAMKDLFNEHEELVKATPSTEPEANTVTTPAKDRTKDRISVSFGITAAEGLQAGHNIGGWKVNVLSRTYIAVSGMVGLTKKSEFRNKFEATHEPMYMCYPGDLFGFLALGALLMVLRK